MELSFYQKINTNYSFEKVNDNYELDIDVPGFKKEDLKIKSEGNSLSVTGKNSKREYSNQFILPKHLEVKDVKAKLANGVLKLIFPTKKDQCNKIEISED